MKNHVLRPLIVFIGIILLILLARFVLVPKDFGVGQRGYMYGWHRTGNEEDWKKFKVKYQGKEYCKDCHSDKYDSINKTPHKIIQCENCHGPAGTPEGIVHYDADKLPKLPIDRSRDTVPPVPLSAVRTRRATDRRSRASIPTSTTPTSSVRAVTIPTIQWEA